MQTRDDIDPLQRWAWGKVIEIIEDLRAQVERERQQEVVGELRRRADRERRLRREVSVKYRSLLVKYRRVVEEARVLQARLVLLEREARDG